MKKILYIFTLIAGIGFVFNSCSEDGLVESGSGTLEGKVVVDGTNVPIANAKITTNPASNTVFTDENGNFSIGEILVGEYSVQAEVEDFITAFEAANIQDGRTVNVVFEMQESSINNQEPLTPILVFPADNATEINTQLEFVWNSSVSDEDPITYAFELRDGTTNEIIMAENLEDTTYAVSGLNLATNYFWQVSASDGVNPEVESSISSFTTFDAFDNRFFFTRKIGNNNVLFSGDDVGPTGEANQGVFQLTPDDENSFRPRLNNLANKVAFLRTVGTETQLFTIARDGSELDQLTDNIPVTGFRQEEVDYSWSRTGGNLYYPNLNKLYIISSNGTNNDLVYEAPSGVFITEVDSNEANNLLAIKTNDANGYNARITIINPNTGIESVVVIENVAGALGGIDFSIDGTKVLYTRDVSGFENSEYRQLDSRIFEYNILTDETTEIDTGKEVGTNDLDAKYSPDEGAIIYMNTSNDGISQRNVFKFVFGGSGGRVLLFNDAFMPDWE